MTSVPTTGDGRASAIDASPEVLGGPGTPGQRARARLLRVAGALMCRVPERLLDPMADLIGALWYRTAPSRAAQGRRNLARVAAWFADRGTGTAAVRAAATDPAALERLVRRAFRENARSYLDLLRLTVLTGDELDRRLTVDTPAVLDEAFATPGARVFVAPHLATIELPGVYLAHRSGRPFVAPMETLADPALQREIARTRAAAGVRLVSLRDARHALAGALERGEIVGLIADRDLTGSGLPVDLFGAPAPLPVGPAFLALEAHAPLYVAGIARRSGGRFRGHIVRVDLPEAGTRRERLAALVAAEARAFEDVIALAPEQWWSVFFPIWPDLVDSPGRTDP